jgi:hypothetical protein
MPTLLASLFVYGLNTVTGMVASQSILQTVIPTTVVMLLALGRLLRILRVY